MKLSIREDSTNYACQVVKLPIQQKVEGLDNLVRVTIFGNDCLIGKDSPIDQLYLFFPAECCIEPRFLCANNLFRHENFNRDQSKKGFFEDSGRVKALKFKGIISTGFVIPITALYSLVSFDLKEGDEFTDIDEINICKKYKVIIDQRAEEKESKNNRKLARFDKLIPNQFRFHSDTSHLAKNLHLFNPNDMILISDKWHGTSAVFSNILIRKKLVLKERIAKFFGVKVLDHKYDNLYSSRSVIKNQYINKEATIGFYNEDIWGTVNKELNGKIEQGITLYGEIVGYLNSGKEIQKGYDYGCQKKNIPMLPSDGEQLIASTIRPIAEHKFLVYRITYTKPDGSVIEFSWQQIKDYCERYSLETVKELYYGRASGAYWTVENPDGEDWRNAFLDFLSKQYLERDCLYCKNKVPAEGICVRLDGRSNYFTFKLKSKKFLEKESKDLDKGEISIEDEQSAEHA